MPTIKILNGVKIMMFFQDHNPPHLHCKLGSDVMRVKFDGDVLTGTLPNGKKDEVLNWISNNQTLLNNKWEEFKK